MLRELFEVFLVSCAVVFAQTNQPVDHFAQAIRLHQAGDLQGAVAEYQACLNQQPDRLEAVSNLGAALAHLGRYSEAIQQYRHALQLSPGDLRIRLNLALAYYKSDHLPEAVDELSGLRKISPENEQVLLLLSDCYFRLGDNKQVIALLRPVAGRAPASRAILYLLGTALIRDNQIGEGQGLIEQLLRDGESPETQFLIGTTQFVGGQYREAARTLARAAEANPDLPDVFAYYGMALVKSGDTSAAERAFRRELARDPANFEANLNLGALLRAQGKLVEALPFLQKSRQIRPHDPQALMETGKLCLAEGRAADAAAAFESVVREDPGLAAAHQALADAYDRLGRPRERDRERAIVQQLEEQAVADSKAGQLHKEIIEKLKTAPLN